MKKYAIISNKKRNQLIARVVQNGESVSRVSKQLRMKLPSAKSIIRTFKKLGKIFDKKMIINRRVKSKRSELSETEHQHSEEDFESNEEQMGQKDKKFQIEMGQQKQINQVTQEVKQIQNPQKIEELMTLYYNQMYLCQQYSYLYNNLHYFHNSNFSPVQF